jgi:hypothetical protein
MRICLTICRISYFIILASRFPSQNAFAATVWTGPTISFTKANFADGALPANQDQITPNVWIARGQTMGLYNPKAEAAFTRFFSPSGTQWATGDLADYATLNYTDWNTWAKFVNGGPPNTVGVHAVVHLVADDVYLSIQFTSWGGGAGGFSYMRSTPATAPPPPPPAPTLTGASVAGGTFSFTFTNNPAYTFTVLSSTDAALPIASWTVVGVATESPAGTYSFSVSTAGADQKFYRVRWSN